MKAENYCLILLIVLGGAFIAIIGAMCVEESVNAEKRRPLMEARAKMWLEAEAQSIKNCLAKGGSPVQSSWDGRLKDCR